MLHKLAPISQRSTKAESNRPPLNPRAAVYVVMLVLIVTVACSIPRWDCGAGSRSINAAQAKRLLLQLPYHYEFRHIPVPKGVEEVVAGKATTARGTFVNFRVILGGYAGSGGIVDTDTLTLGKQHHWHTPAQFRTGRELNEATTMSVEMEEKMCKFATGKPCPP